MKPQIIEQINDRLAGMDDDQLQELLDENLDSIAYWAEQDGIKLDKHGLMPDDFAKDFPPGRMGHASALERKQEQVKAIRKVLPQREKQRKQEAKHKQAETKARLEQIVASGPVDAAHITKEAEQAMPAVERVRQFVEDLRTMANASLLPGSHASVARGVEEAAAGLGEPQPKMPALPENMPDRDEVNSIIALLSGRGAGFSRPRIVAGSKDYGRAAELVRELKQ